MNNRHLRISFAGDLCLEDLHQDSYIIHPEISEIFASSDLNVVNLESPLTRSRDKTPGRAFNFKAPPEPGKVFNLFQVFSLANNHILDYSLSGLQETMSFISSRNKSFFGAGGSLDQASAPLKLEAGGMPLAFLGCTRWYNADKFSGGTMPMKHNIILPEIQRLKQDGYFVIVFPHWNYEYVDHPCPADRKFGHRLIQAGADVVVGSHPHQIQGWESYQGRYIFHSLGNFIFNQFDLSRTEFSRTFILTLNINPDATYSFEIHPVFTTQEGIFPLRDKANKDFMDKMAFLCRILENPALHRKKFYENSETIINAAMQGFNSAADGAHPFIELLKRLPRARPQDVLIKIHSLIQRRKKNSA